MLWRQVIVRCLDPRVRRPPRDDPNISSWNPKSIVLNTHRLGLSHMVAGGHVLVTSGGSGSVKIWPETSLRCAAAEAGECHHDACACCCVWYKYELAVV